MEAEGGFTDRCSEAILVEIELVSPEFYGTN